MLKMRTNVRSEIKRLWGEIRWAVLAGFWIVNLLLGYLGFTKFSSQNAISYSIFDRVYLSLQLISMNSGAVEGQMNGMLQVARFLIPALAAFTVFQAIINLFREQTQWLTLWRWRDHVVVCGLGRKGARLVDDLVANGFRVVAIENAIVPVTADDYRRRGVIVIQGDATEGETLKSARLLRASHLVCLLGKDELNLRIALQARRLLQGKKGEKLTCILHLVSEDLFDLVKKSELSLDEDDPLTLEIFNTYEREAHHLLTSLWQQAAGGLREPSRLLVIGLGRLGQNILRQAAYRRYNSIENERLEITVVDQAASSRIEHLLAEYPQIAKVSDFHPVQVDLTSVNVWKQALLEGAKDTGFDQIYICLGNSILGVQVCLNLAQMPEFLGVPIFVRMEKDSGLGELLESSIGGQVSQSRIIPFDMYDQTCSASLIFGGLHELLAIKLRENYLQGLDATIANQLSKIPWEDVSEQEKDANRQQANRICHVLDGGGYSINTLQNWDTGKLIFTPDQVQQMAQLEHALWSQWKRETGWHYAPKRDDEQKFHPDLVPWKDLPESEKKKNEDYIRTLPALLAELGFQIDKKR